MAAFKDKKNGSWYVQFRYTDWRGERQQKLKRGFATKKEAQAWEREFLMQKQADVNMSFESFVALYEKDVKPKLKLNTWLSKEHIIRTKILPYFKKRKLSEITARDVIDWQNEIRQHTKSSGESYSPDYQERPYPTELYFQPRHQVLRLADQSSCKGRKYGQRAAEGNAVLDEGRIPQIHRRHDGQAHAVLRL